MITQSTQQPRTGSGERSGRRRLRVLMISIGVLTALIVGGIGVYAYRVLQPVASITGLSVQRTSQELALLHQLEHLYPSNAAPSTTTDPLLTSKNSLLPLTVPSLQRDQRINILLLASDNDQKFAPAQGYQFPLTQVMIVASLDPQHNTVTLMSIPRDFYVPVAGHGMHKIDEASMLGNISLARATVEQNFHIWINNYAWLGLSGFVKVIDAMGGIDIDSPFPILDDAYPNDMATPNSPYTSRRLYISAGPQHFDGLHALQYVRSRHGTLLQDFARSLHQQQVLVQLRQKLHGADLVTQLPTITALLSNDIVRTDLTAQDLLALALYASQNHPQITKQIVLSPPQFAADTQLATGEDIVQPNWKTILPVVGQLLAPLGGPQKQTGVTPSRGAAQLIPSHTVPQAASAQTPAPSPIIVLTAAASPRVTEQKRGDIAGKADGTVNVAALRATSARSRAAGARLQPQARVAQQTAGRTRAALSMTGHLIFAVQGNLWVADSAGTQQLAAFGDAHDPQISPDGTTIVFERQRTNTSDLFSAPLIGMTSTRPTLGVLQTLTHDNVNPNYLPANYWAASPSWSPDGQSLLYITDRAKNPGAVIPPVMAVWRLNLATGAISQQTLPNDWTGGDTDPAWRPSNSAQFAFTRYTYDASVPRIAGQVVLDDASAGTLTPLTNNADGALQASWSPDGRALALVVRHQTGDDIRVLLFASPTSPTVVSSSTLPLGVGMFGQPTWSPDGKALAYAIQANGNFHLQMIRLTTSGTSLMVGTPQDIPGTDSVDAASRLAWTR